MPLADMVSPPAVRARAPKIVVVPLNALRSFPPTAAPVPTNVGLPAADILSPWPVAPIEPETALPDDPLADMVSFPAVRAIEPETTGLPTADIESPTAVTAKVPETAEPISPAADIVSLAAVREKVPTIVVVPLAELVSFPAVRERVPRTVVVPEAEEVSFPPVTAIVPVEPPPETSWSATPVSVAQLRSACAAHACVVPVAMIAEVLCPCSAEANGV